MPFKNRSEAGKRLAQRLAGLRGQSVLVLGVPRGGVPVAFEVARHLDAPLDVIVVRKLGVPFQPELAMGAIGEGGVRILNEYVVRRSGVTDVELRAVTNHELVELAARTRRLRGDRPQLCLADRNVVIVDDGIATGASAHAACQVARKQGAMRVVVAAPVCAKDAVDSLRTVADEVVYLESPRQFCGVGEWYVDFGQTSDGEVVSLLAQASAADRATVVNQRSDAEPDPPEICERDIRPTAGTTALAGRLAVPTGANRLVVFAHGSGSSRHSPRNRFVASALNQKGFATALLDLLTVEEEGDRTMVFDAALLASRLAAATRQLREGFAQVGYFGASTGAAAALWAAVESDTGVGAVVCRGGRPDLAWGRLPLVKAPTLLIVGSRDRTVLDLNHSAQARMRCTTELAVIPGATHLFEEPGALQAVSGLASDWFGTHLMVKLDNTFG
ncbi:phosphoribosyltransferase family protein [Kutzneria albida]|uniref:Phosphoribosyltransferase domain-containing protein n=1 Tax=Kutzneria albida DSM 43870 TaxID=1449976 RepID=W5W8S1_9PSEU|nr:alpha/beta family hydrolase [Kutzneria albida]AHH97538.1 hypothetical protein KALB_4174 [Kutzneria albida DSM 43870]